ncbi:MAG: ArnT family glycosyltransferase, partial [Solirubrobacterales bacterium]
MNSISMPIEADTQPRSRTDALSRILARPELIVLLVAAGLLYMWGLSKNGTANEYYSATVRAMSSSWHNFVYGSFDMSGVMTVDKPPLAFWIQSLSVRVFGYSSWSMLVPQALMGVATVGLTYNIVGRRFGRWPAFTAGAVLALTPMTVAISRHNNPDAMLILLSVAAVWFVVRGLEDGRTRWIVAAGAAVGAAFTTKMGAGLLVLPALFAAYLWAAPVSRKQAFGQLLLGGGVFLAVAAAWPLLMALTPAASRPWISGTTDNSIWSLITQYNGLGRLNGQMGGPGGGGMGGGGGVFGGSTGITRLFNSALGPQVS